MFVELQKARRFFQALIYQHFLPHPVENFEVCESHLGWVFLTGPYAYKMRKPVAIEGLVDYSTPEKRRHFLSLELQLNREFGRVSLKYENKEVQQTYNALKREISHLSKTLGGIKEYNTKEIPWSKVNRLAKKANTIRWKLSEKLRDEKAKAETGDHNSESAEPRPEPDCEKVSS